MRFIPGARARIYIGSRWSEISIKQVLEDGILLTPPEERNVRLTYNQPVSMLQQVSGGCLMALLRYQERGRRGGTVQDLYAVVPGTLTQLRSGMHKVQMYDWCDLTVFEVHRPEQVHWEGKAYLFELTGDTAGVIVAEEFPRGAFAECTFRLGGDAVTAQLLVDRVEKQGGSPLTRARLSFIGQALRPKIEGYLVEERAKRMRDAGY